MIRILENRLDTKNYKIKFTQKCEFKDHPQIDADIKHLEHIYTRYLSKIDSQFMKNLNSWMKEADEDLGKFVEVDVEAELDERSFSPVSYFEFSFESTKNLDNYDIEYLCESLSEFFFDNGDSIEMLFTGTLVYETPRYDPSRGGLELYTSHQPDYEFSDYLRPEGRCIVTNVTEYF